MFSLSSGAGLCETVIASDSIRLDDGAYFEDMRRIMGADASMHFMQCAYPAPQMSENSLPCGRHMCSAALGPSRVCCKQVQQNVLD